MEGIIIKNESNNYTVRTNKGINICKPRGKFRLDKITPLVGDKVIIDDINNYLLEIKPRKNSLIRPQIANVDIALIVTSVKEPNFDSNLLDKLLTIISYNNIEPIICLTKTDLLNEEEEKNIKVSLHKEKVEGASYIETEYTVLKSTEKASLLKIRLITGKSHQIRGHLASTGHPVFGDYKYGNREFNNQIKWKEGINYQLLHSYELIVPEGTGELSGLHIIDPVPEAFHQVQKNWNLEFSGLSYTKTYHTKTPHTKNSYTKTSHQATFRSDKRKNDREGRK